MRPILFVLAILMATHLIMTTTGMDILDFIASGEMDKKVKRNEACFKCVRELGDVKCNNATKAGMRDAYDFCSRMDWPQQMDCIVVLGLPPVECAKQIKICMPRCTNSTKKI